MTERMVIVGGGQAGQQLALSLRSGGFEGEVHLLCAEPHLPYQRPPLSKGYLSGKQTEAALFFRPESFYAEHGIDLHLGLRAERLDRESRTVALSNGTALAYDRLALATGANVRHLALEGGDLEGVAGLRTIEDSDSIRARLAAAGKVVIVGGGFIGLEVAAVAAEMGKAVTLLEAADRLMGRVVAPPISDHYAALHRAHGVDLRLGAPIEAIEARDGVVTAVVAGGQRLETDLLVVGIGVIPCDALAREAGLDCDNGILVDRSMRTSDPAIFAVGDCANHENPFAGRRLRLESVQNAIDQAQVAARAMMGQEAVYEAVPWFWTDQYDAKLQMVGISSDYEELVRRGDPESGRFSVFYFRGGRLVAIDSVNRPADHMAGRKLIAAGGGGVTPEQARDPDWDIKAAMKALG